VKAFEMFPEACAESMQIIAMAERLKLQTVTDFESSIDPDDHVFMYQEKTGMQTARLPKKIKLLVPYFESGEKVSIEVDVEIVKPKSAEDKPVFVLKDMKAARTKRDALKAEIEKIRTSLADWMFIQGEANS
jgi:hypothetical protein